MTREPDVPSRSTSPLYDETLSDLLLTARRTAERAEAGAARVVAQAERVARVRRALIVEEVEDRVRHALALDAPPLPPLRPVTVAEPEPEPEAPPVPSMDEMLLPSPGVGRFLDALLGPGTT